MNRLAYSILRGLADPGDAVATALERMIQERTADHVRFEHLVRNEAHSLRTKTLRTRRQETPIGLIPDLAELEESLAHAGRGLPFFGGDFDLAVRDLPEAQREAFILTDLRGLTHEDAADLLELNQSTVTRRVDAARAYIREELAA